MLNFQIDYLNAMRDHAPKMFVELRKTGTMDQHLHEKSEEARRLFRQLTEGAEQLQSGALANPHEEAEAREQVYATLITFPSADPEDDES